MFGSKTFAMIISTVAAFSFDTFHQHYGFFQTTFRVKSQGFESVLFIIGTAMTVSHPPLIM